MLLTNKAFYDYISEDDNLSPEANQDETSNTTSIKLSISKRKLNTKNKIKMPKPMEIPKEEDHNYNDNVRLLCTQLL